MKRAAAPALIVQEERPAIPQHDVARLEISIKEVITRGRQQEIGQALKVILHRLFVERNSSEPQKVVLEVIQIPSNGLAIEAVARIAGVVIEIAPCLDLES